MPDAGLSDKTLERLVERYEEMTPTSRTLHERAKRTLPGGYTRSVYYHQPYPFFAERGAGCYVWDVDGNRYLDLVANFGSLPLGHAHPDVVQAINDQMTRGSQFGNPTELESKLAEMIVERMPSIELLRYTGSGTEATLGAIQVARAVTGRDRIAKFEGGYHGWHDAVAMSVRPALTAAGPENAPAAIPWGPGISKSALADTVILPFNRQEETYRLLEQHRRDLAAVIIEPVQSNGGVIPAKDGFLQFLRQATQDLGVLLIFDEVVTLFADYGGAQAVYGVKPDLTAVGKVIGGGIPIGAYGGRADIMARYDPARPDKVPASGTFSGNPVALAAGIATLNVLTRAKYQELFEHAENLRAGLLRLFERRGLPAQITRAGALFNIHFLEEEIVNYRQVAKENAKLMKLLHLALLTHGVYLSAQGRGWVTTPVTSADVEFFVEAMEKALDDVLSG